MTLNFFERGCGGWSLGGKPFSFELKMLGEKVARLLSDLALRCSIT